MYQYDENFVELPEKKYELLHGCMRIILEDPNRGKANPQLGAMLKRIEKEGISNMMTTMRRRATAAAAAASAEDESGSQASGATTAPKDCLTPFELVFMMRVIDPIAQTQSTEEELQAIVAAELLMSEEDASSGRISIFQASQEFLKQQYEPVITFADLCVMFESKPVNPNCEEMVIHALDLQQKGRKLLATTEKEETNQRTEIAHQEEQAVTAMHSQLRRAVHISTLRNQLSFDFAQGKRALETKNFTQASKQDAERLKSLKKEQTSVKEEGKKYIDAMTRLEATTSRVEEDMTNYHEQINIMGKWRETGIELAKSEVESEWKTFFAALNKRYAETEALFDRVEGNIVNVGRELLRTSLHRGFQNHQAALKELEGSAASSGDFSWLAPDGAEVLDLTTTTSDGVDKWKLQPDPLLDLNTLTPGSGSARRPEVGAHAQQRQGDVSQWDFAVEMLAGLSQPFFKDHRTTDTQKPVMTFDTFRRFIETVKADVPGSLAITFLDFADEKTAVVVEPEQQQLHKTATRAGAGGEGTKSTTTTTSEIVPALTVQALALVLLDLAKLAYGPPSDAVSECFLLERFVSSYIRPALLHATPCPEGGPENSSKWRGPAVFEGGLCGALRELASYEVPDIRYERLAAKFASLCSTTEGAPATNLSSSIRQALYATELLPIPRELRDQFCLSGSGDEGFLSLSPAAQRHSIAGAEPLPLYCTVRDHLASDRIFFAPLLFTLTSTDAHQRDIPLGTLADWCLTACQANKTSGAALEQRLLSVFCDALEQTVARVDGKFSEPIFDFWGTGDKDLKRAGDQFMVPFVLFVACLPALCGGGGCEPFPSSVPQLMKQLTVD